jgi:Protein of unknown function (DUF1579)
MKKSAKLSFILTAISLFLPTLLVNAQDDMKAMMDYMTPGTQQQAIAKSAGNWNGTVSYWTHPGADPITATMDGKNEMILGGRYLQTRNTGTMMGMPFEGVGLTGYDNAKKIFVSSWIDNMGTGILYMEGNWDDQHKSINFNGKTVDPSTGKDVPIRQVLKFVDDNNQILEMYMSVNGTEFKAMEIKYIRK